MTKAHAPVALQQVQVVASRAQQTALGLVVPFDFALDAEYWRWMPPEASLCITRTPRIENTDVTADLAREVSDTDVVATAVQSLVAVQPKSIGYACTSGSFVDGVSGEAQLQNTMVAAGTAEAVTTSGALLQALTHLGIKRLSIATPYNLQLSELLVDFLHEAGHTVVAGAYLDKEEGIARVSDEAVRQLARTVDHPQAEALFFSCTNLWTYDLIEELEQELGKPVLSANQVTIWAMLQKAGIDIPHNDQRLFTARSQSPPKSR